MSDRSSIVLTDDLLAEALRPVLRPALRDEVAEAIVAAVEVTPQRRRRLRLPQFEVPCLPILDRRARTGLLLLLAALFLLTVAIAIATIGARPQLPPPFGLAKSGLVVFDSNGDLFVSAPDGTGERLLVGGPRFDVQGTWSPDGTKIAYWSWQRTTDPEPLLVDLVVVDEDGSHRVTLTTFSADQLVAVPETTGGPDTRLRRLSWAPDSRSLAWSAFVNGSHRMFVAYVDGSAIRLLGDGSLDGQDPTWSPDGTQIAFYGGRYDVDRGIYLMAAAGGQPVRLSHAKSGPWSFAEPVWSPDGQRLAYAALPPASAGEVEPRDDIWILDVATGTEGDISATGDEDQWPSWSPDGLWLAYEHGEAGIGRPAKNHLVVARGDGSDPTEIPVTVASSTPGWSPDGTHLIVYAYNETIGYPDQLLLVDWRSGRVNAVSGAGTPGAAGSEQRLTP
jgi:Tol biopolymer transport system component